MGQVSAGTINTICEQICSTGATGSAVVSVRPPNPTYSDLTGGTVVQLGMVVIGGPNGLNS